MFNFVVGVGSEMVLEGCLNIFILQTQGKDAPHQAPSRELNKKERSELKIKIKLKLKR